MHRPPLTPCLPSGSIFQAETVSYFPTVLLQRGLPDRSLPSHAKHEWRLRRESVKGSRHWYGAARVDAASADCTLARAKPESPITRGETFRMQLGKHKIAKMSVSVMGSAWRNLTFLKLTTDEGLTGISEVRLSNRTNALLGYLEECKKRYLLGADPFRIEQIVQRMFRDDYGRVGEVCASGISLVEIACWDIVGKAAQLPVYVLLGGAVRDRIKAYANAWYQVPRTPEEFGRAAK